ncbi:hypothetical protein [Absidia glauca]|uniref:Uncharacterized protein n=1 Tax=Absidia glauca TaxID=4829 RepID=A0A168LIH5_ABSGL|nr:hypothetical protein [Absidia glauca]
MTTPPRSIAEIAQHGFIASALTAMSGGAIGTIVALFNQRPIRHYGGLLTLHSFAVSMAFHAARESYLYYRENRDDPYRSPTIRKAETDTANNLGSIAWVLATTTFSKPNTPEFG